MNSLIPCGLDDPRIRFEPDLIDIDELEDPRNDMEKRLEWLCDEWAGAQDDDTLESWRDVRMAIHGASLALIYCSADDRLEDRMALMEMSALAFQHSQDCISAGRFEGTK